ncbi:tetratricopeptide repeat protein [Chryseobacterium arthrosphaerae]|uniref:Tetratricopeptide repeat protein n=1 Tax=Chryseobacterium arthrosphaerae TaxID=651561 RepID=A0A432E136_9FLAO|nr:tetratricopeptide repeat protein [Chryseobacterium arthrosphaerae]
MLCRLGIILVESFKKNKDQEDLKTAISNLNKTIELDPTNALAYSNMAAIKYDAILLNKDSYSFTEVFDFLKIYKIGS